MLLHGLNGYLLPVKDTCGQSGLHIGLFKDLREVFNLSGTTGGNDRDGDVFADMFYKFNIKTADGTVFVNTVK
jgi:hypothetical protein